MIVWLGWKRYRVQVMACVGFSTHCLWNGVGPNNVCKGSLKFLRWKAMAHFSRSFASSPNRWGNNVNSWQTVLGSKIIADGDCSHDIKRCLLLERKAMTNLDSTKQRYYFVDKGPSNQSYGFSSSHVQMWELNHKESWALKNWCFWTVVLEKTLESPLDCKEISQS